MIIGLIINMEQNYDIDSGKTDYYPQQNEVVHKSDIFLTTVLVILSFILPLSFISSSIVDAISLKGFILLSAIYVLLFIWSVTRLRKNTFYVPFNLISLSAGLILISALASSIFSDNFGVSFWGRDFGFDSSFYIISLIVFFLLASFLLREVKNSVYVYFLLFFSSVLIFVFQILLVLFPNLIPDFGYFFQNTSNTIGTWFHLGFFAGLTTILSLISIGLLKKIGRLSMLINILLVLSLVVLLIVGSFSLWLIVGIFALINFIYLILNDKKESLETNKNFLPIHSLIVIVIVATILLSGFGSQNSINNKIYSVLDINFVDIKLSFSATYEVAKDALINSPIIGKDFISFDQVWVKYKPESINLSEFWSTDFRYGYGLLPTYFSLFGLFGIVSWVLFLSAIIYFGFNSIFKENRSLLSKYILASSFFATLYLWTVSFIYVSNHVILFLAFLFTAVFVGSLYRENLITVKEFSISKTPRCGFVYVFVVVIILISSITSLYNLTEKFISQIYLRQSLVAIQNSDLTLAKEKIIKAINFESTDLLFRNLSDVQRAEAANVQNLTELSETNKANLFNNYISGAIQSAYAAVEYDPTNYVNYYHLGNLFIDLIPLKLEGLVDRSVESLTRARELNPTNPEIPLALARIYLASEQFDLAKKLVNESIIIKPNYTEAVYLLSQVNVAEGEIEKAIENVRTTTLVRPNDPVTYFQLGLLQYQNNNFNDSIVSFETALGLDQFYANAKYFLGLSYYQVDRVTDAKNIFRELSKTNPNNQEVSFILNNLENGFAPFYGLSNSDLDVSDQPENRDEPPLNDDRPEDQDVENEDE